MTTAAQSAARAARRELARLLGPGRVLGGDLRDYLVDATESRDLRGRADAVVAPANGEQVRTTVEWCYEHDVAIVPRGGGTGFSGGSVPLDGGVVVSLERCSSIREIDPAYWRALVEAGVRTAVLRRRARENGLLFPPDPGAADQSQIGGNVATNAGGPHAFKYGVTGAWVTGLEAVVAPGELLTIGGPIRKDVAGYDLKSLMVWSERTLGIVTSVWLKLIPAPELALPVVAFYPDLDTGCGALERALVSGSIPAALEFLDDRTVQLTADAFPGIVPAGSTFMLIVDADGAEEEAVRVRSEMLEALAPGALDTHAPQRRSEINALWRWRDGASIAVTAKLGGKVSEDIVVPVDHLHDTIRATQEIGARHKLEACSWGQAGDGTFTPHFSSTRPTPTSLNVHVSRPRISSSWRAGWTALRQESTGIGVVNKRGAIAKQWSPTGAALHESIKAVFDPKGLLNPGKKLAR